jgi:hypothetical protein
MKSVHKIQFPFFYDWLISTIPISVSAIEGIGTPYDY